jgi:hypothetical protein
MSRRPRGETGAESAATQRSFVAAAVVLIVIAGFALVLIVTGPSRPAKPSERMPDPAAARPATTQVVAQAKCRLRGGDQRVPSTAPPDTRWELVGTMLAPAAPETLGPGNAEDGLRSCFAHSPIGALYAAVNFWALGTAKPSGQVIRRLAATGAERTRTVTRLASQPDVPAISHSMQVAGFRLASYEPSAVTVSLAMRLSNGGLASFPTTLRWEDGDWKYVIAPGGNPGVTQLPNLAGYIAWGGA